ASESAPPRAQLLLELLQRDAETLRTIAPHGGGGCPRVAKYHFIRGRQAPFLPEGLVGGFERGKSPPAGEAAGAGAGGVMGSRVLEISSNSPHVRVGQCI